MLQCLSIGNISSSQMFAEKGFTVYASAVALFGENVERLRKAAKLTQEGLADRMKLKKPTPISLMEGPRKAKVPRPATIRKLAAALGVRTADLMDGVITEYDRLRGDAPHKKKGEPLTSPDTGSGVQLALTPDSGGAHDRSASSTSRLYEERYRALTVKALFTAERLFVVADELRERSEELTRLAEGDIPDTGGASSAATASHRGRRRPSHSQLSTGKKGRRQ